jgi:hypothetical protein
MTIDPAPILGFAIPFALIAGGIAVLTKLAGTKWMLGLFESEGEPSARIILACATVVFTLFMQAAGRISDNMVEANYFLAGTLLGLGTTKLIATRFAARPAAPATQIKANVAPVTSETTNINTPPQP